VVVHGYVAPAHWAVVRLDDQALGLQATDLHVHDYLWDGHALQQLPIVLAVALYLVRLRQQYHQTGHF